MEEQKQAVQESEAAAREIAELKRKQKVFKIIIAFFVFGTLMIAAALAFMYTKIENFRNSIFSPGEEYSSGGLSGERDDLVRSPAKDVSSTASMQSSGLAAFSSALSLEASSTNSAAAPAAISPERARKAVMKYYRRPVVQEMMADMMKDPNFAMAMKKADGKDPMAFLSALGKADGSRVLAKYSTRPEFISLMMEIMRDPEIKALREASPIAGSMKIPSMTSPFQEASGGSSVQDACGSGGAGCPRKSRVGSGSVNPPPAIGD